MPDNAVSTSDRRSHPERRKYLWRLAACSLLIGALIVTVAFVALQLRTLYHVQTDLAILQQDHAEMKRSHNELARETSQRLDDLESVLFGKVIKELMAVEQKPIAPPLRLQQWMVNRDKELRERLDRLERWRLDQDKRFE